LGGALRAASPAYRELRLQPLSAGVAAPVRSRSRLVAGVPLYEAHCQVPITLVLQPQVGTALIHRNFARDALQMLASQMTSDACLLQQVDPMLGKHQIRGASQSEHKPLPQSMIRP